MTAATMTAAGAPARTIPLRRIAAFFAMVFGMFMAILDIQIVSASLAEIQAGLAASSDEIAWVQTAYLIAEVVMIPLSGYLSRALSTRVFFTLSTIGFTAASFMCAMSTSINEMILWRALQGFIGGGMIPGVFAAAFTIFPPDKRPIVSPIVGLVATLAPTIGPTVGGYLSHAFSWHWLFLVNIVPGIAVATAAWTLIDFDKPDHRLLRHFDWWALLGLAAFLGSLEYVLEEGNAKDWYQSTAITVFTGVMIIGGMLFFARTLTSRHPLVDLHAFRNRNFAFGSMFSFSVGIGLYGLTYVYPVFLARIRGYDSLMIGTTMFVSGLAMFCAAPVAGALSRRMDPRLMMAIGLIGFGAGTYLASHMTKDWDFNELLWPQILRGGSMMLCMVPINNVALGTLRPEQIRGASGLYNLMRNLGGAVGLAVINSTLVDRAALHYDRLREAVNSASTTAMETVAGLAQTFSGAEGYGDLLALKQIAGMARREATVMAFDDVFLLLTVLFALLASATFIMQKPAPLTGGGGGGH